VDAGKGDCRNSFGFGLLLPQGPPCLPPCRSLLDQHLIGAPPTSFCPFHTGRIPASCRIPHHPRASGRVFSRFFTYGARPVPPSPFLLLCSFPSPWPCPMTRRKRSGRFHRRNAEKGDAQGNFSTKLQIRTDTSSCEKVVSTPIGVVPTSCRRL